MLMKMKKAVPVVVVAILALGSLSGCKPRAVPAVPATDKGYTLCSHHIGVSPSTFIQALQQNGFETIEGKTFEQVVPRDDQSRAYIGIVALRDRTVKEPNEFIVGVGSDTFTYYQSHNVSGEERIKDWNTHVEKRIDLVKKLATNKKQSHQKSEPDVKTVLLQCNKAATRTGWSFVTGKMPTSRREADIILYFDKDDCSQGAIFGSDDEEGYIFPIGHKLWSELSLADVPQEDTKSVIGFLPMTKDKEGLAFWVKTRNDRYALVKIKSVRPSSFSGLSSGHTAEIVLEWTWGKTGQEDN